MKVSENLKSENGFLISKLSILIQKDLEIGLADFGIRLKQYAILQLIEGNSKFNQRAVGEILLLDRNTVVHFIDDLEKKGFLERKRNPEDRRSYFVVISKAGKKMLEKIKPSIDEIRKAQLSSLSEEEKTLLNNLLKKVLFSYLQRS